MADVRYKVIKTERYVDGETKYEFNNILELLEVFPNWEPWFPADDSSLHRLSIIPEPGHSISVDYDHYITLDITAERD